MAHHWIEVNKRHDAVAGVSVAAVALATAIAYAQLFLVSPSSRALNASNLYPTRGTRERC